MLNNISLLLLNKTKEKIYIHLEKQKYKNITDK